ncbi:Growth hormone receptor [Channa argus]|uniref:Growth hormone receptor n=1 Tax=Channa argus TaxID=215402 RepID=A0A6G1PE75_CHAAH|nr:Growth hormone receptor [Channa argus]
MLWLLLCLLPPLGGGRVVTQDVTYEERHEHEDVAVTTRPHIYYCRSPNMEDFTCWWHPLSNLTDGEQTGTSLASWPRSTEPVPSDQDKWDCACDPSAGNIQGVWECPDYVSAGPNSCHFDSGHTAIWTMYCMNVTAVTAHRNYTSLEHCLDVADIVQTEAPVNLTYTLMDAGGDELGHRALLSWTYPEPSHLQYGWITLLYELQYRRLTEPDNWKVKHPLREPSVELLGLPVGDYVVRVRCRSRNYGLWSKWSSTLLMSLPSRPPAGKLLVLILVTAVGVVALLGIIFGFVPQSKRIKDYLLPPIPKPRITGIDPLLLKKGNLDEINRHFSNFHSYRPPSYAEDVWDQVNSDSIFLTVPKDCSILTDSTNRKKEALSVPSDQTPVSSCHQSTTQNGTSYVQSLPPYCSSPPAAFSRSLDRPPSRPRPEMVSLPGTDYSVMGNPSVPDATASRSPQDFYTCVQLMNESGELHLVPCLQPAYCSEFSPLQRRHSDPKEMEEEEEEKKKQLAEFQTPNHLIKGPQDGGEAERSEAAITLLPVTVENNS